MELYGAGIFLKKILNKLMQGERDFGGRKYFSKISYLPSPLKVNWIPLSTPFVLYTIADQQTDVTHPPTRPQQNRKAQCLENENEAKSRCQRGRQKVRQWLRHGHARLYLDPILIFSHFECDGRMDKERKVANNFFFWGGGGRAVSSHPPGRQNADKEELFSFL